MAAFRPFPVFDHIGVAVEPAKFLQEVEFMNHALHPLGISEQERHMPKVSAFGPDKSQKYLWIMGNRGEQSVTAPVHLAFRASHKSQVDEFFKAGMSVGGLERGAPGLRPDYHATYYAAYMVSPGGHNIEVVYHGAE